MTSLANALYGPPWLSWTTTLLGSSLFGVWFLVLVRVTRKVPILARWSARGAGFGLVVLPLALWLYAHFFAGPLRALFLGFPGLFLLIHFAPFQEVSALSHGMVEDMASGARAALATCLFRGTALWVVTYGLFGLLVSWIVRWRRRANAA